MGMLMEEDDMYIGGLLEALNLYFGKFPDTKDTDTDILNGDENQMLLNVNGINEIFAIQQEFQVFRPGLALVKSLRALGVGGQWNNTLKRKWYKLLNRLDDYPSSDPANTGGKAIVAALIDHLAPEHWRPDPVHFMAHDSSTQAGGARVLIFKHQRPLFYMGQDFLTISIPMKDRQLTAQTPVPPMP